MSEKFNRATFTVEILNNQHNSWQGRIKWIEENKTEYFRSSLELLKLIDSAIQNQKKEESVVDKIIANHRRTNEEISKNIESILNVASELYSLPGIKKIDIRKINPDHKNYVFISSNHSGIKVIYGSQDLNRLLYFVSRYYINSCLGENEYAKYSAMAYYLISFLGKIKEIDKEEIDSSYLEELKQQHKKEEIENILIKHNFFCGN